MDALSSSRLHLRPLSEADYPLLLSWRNSDEYIALVSPQRTAVSCEEMVTELKKSNRHLHFIIETVKPIRPVGFIYTFGLNLIDGHVFMNTFVEHASRQRGYGAEASIILTCYLLDMFPLFKIYYEAFGYNNPSLSMMRTAGLIEEGCFRGHRFWQGEHHDVVRFAAYRDNLGHIRELEKKFKHRRS